MGDRIIARLTNVDLEDDDDVRWLDAAQRRFDETHADPATAAEIADLRAELADHEKEQEQLFEDRAAGVFNSPYGRQQLAKETAKVAENIEAVQRRIEELEQRATPLLNPEIWLPLDGGDPTGPGSWWGESSDADKRDMVRLFVRRIVVGKAAKVGGRYDPSSMRERVSIEWLME